MLSLLFSDTELQIYESIIDGVLRAAKRNSAFGLVSTTSCKESNISSKTGWYSSKERAESPILDTSKSIDSSNVLGYSADLFPQAQNTRAIISIGIRRFVLYDLFLKDYCQYIILESAILLTQSLRKGLLFRHSA